MDFYVLLGVEREATQGDIKRAYRRLARKYHPDINPGDHTAEAFFRQLVEAYETLMDPERRLHYDRGGVVNVADEPSYEFQGFDFSVMANGSVASTFGELFAEAFRPPAPERGGRAERGADLHAGLGLSFEEAMQGAERAITVTRRETCPACQGAGTLRTAESRCAHCHGTGSQRSARGHMVFSRRCAQCGGSGQQRSRGCQACGGDGISARAETVTIGVPPGVGDGQRIRVPGKGNGGQRGGPPGDLFVTVRVAPHPLFERRGADLFIVVPIAIHEAALGAKIEVPSIDGTARLRVPPGTQSGQCFRLAGRGAPSGGDARGDLVVEVRLVLPRLIDERSKELLREFGRLHPDDVRKDLRA